ncbi:hypothetical protein NQ317_007880 [Molorchus minor]|uniref:C2H2-type domain-containing protein n=1 Tax=Molorchus minor TaxID=1323400 RepID=A0ABQ9JS62_9CUCU|nr:hypothetical protein NQ317_007880 [Molorchus minor]
MMYDLDMIPLNAILYIEIAVYQIMMDSITCASCVRTLTSYFTFATTCEGIEEKIKLYHEIQQREGKIKLSNVLTFVGDCIQYNNDNIKKEGILDNLENRFTCPDIKEVELDSGVECKQKSVEMYTCKTGQYQTKHTLFFKRHLLKLKTKYRRCLKRHLLGHKDISEIKTYKCELCQYQTKHRRSLKRHLLSHKDISEVQTFKCETCPFQTRRKENLKRHLLSHQDVSEVQMFKCETCPYQTKRKENLKRHLLSHRDI